MNDKRVRIAILVASILGAAVGGYYFGAASTRSATRSMEAASDLLVPVDDMRLDRIRREAIREALVDLAAVQDSTYRATQGFLAQDVLPLDRDAIILEVIESTHCAGHPIGCVPGSRWLGVARHVTSPGGEVCAVALNVEPAHLSGIPLKRAGRVRCSWDLATRLNTLLW